MYKTTSKRAVRFVALMLSFCLITALIPANTFAYTVKQLGQYSPVSAVESGDPAGQDYIKLETSGTAMTVTFKHSQAYDRIVLRLLKDGTYYPGDKYFTDQVAAGSTFLQQYDFSAIPNGNYYFRIVTEKAEQGIAGLQQYSTALPGVLVTVSGGVPAIQQYQNIAASNVDADKVASKALYTEKSLGDLRYQLFAKKGTKKDYRKVSSSEATYYKKISNSIVASGDSDYTKLKKIFTYVAQNFYYDHYGVATKKAAFDDPYNNLKYLVNGTGNDYNAYQGKVALQCDGYAGVFTALARAQGIPCRIVYGRKITSGSTTWAEAAGYMNKSSHTWVEAWANGRWINIDPQQGSYSSYTASKQWLKTVLINYTFFDISNTMLAYTHYTHTIPGGNTSVAYMTNSKEISQMKAFLNLKYSGKTNGKRLNKNYKSSKASTWSSKSYFYTDGYGRVQYINWPKKSLVGTLNLSNYKKLKNITVYQNKLKGLNTKGCSSIQTVYASGNKITSVNLLSAKSLKKADYRSNPLVKAQLYTNKRTVTIAAAKGGTFGFKYQNNKITVYPKAKSGYKYVGLYNSKGKRISTSKSGYTFKATGKTYTVKFKKL